MSRKCFVISSCICFLVVSFIILTTWTGFPWYISNKYGGMPTAEFNNEEFALILSSKLTAELKSPSFESFIRASTAGNSVKCLAVYLNLTNACQTLDDVSKVKAQVPKIALVTLVNESTCTLQELAGNVQNAGYSVLIYFAASYAIATVKNSENKVLIPVAIENMAHPWTDDSWYSTLSNADLTKYVEISAYTDELTRMESYLKKLYFWFLIGPLITLEWMRRTRKFCWMKFCWMSDSQDDQREAEERTTENERNAVENEIRTTEEGENGTEESRQLLPLNCQGSSFSQRSCEEQPLLDVEYTRQPRRIGMVKRSLDNLKLTALRTVAIGLTLKVSFSSSMHIIRKLSKPVESLFEGLSETGNPYGSRKALTPGVAYLFTESEQVGMSLSSTFSNELKSPTLESFIRETTKGNSLKGLAVYLNLTDACQALDEVSKIRTQVPKIALVTLVDESTCTLQELAGNVQNAGYSVLIYFAASYAIATVKNSKNKVLIPVASASKENQIPELSDADGTYVELRLIVIPFNTDELRKMEPYLKRLYLWFLIGPLITLEWMRRRRKFCWMTDGPNDQAGEERATENERNTAENEIRTMEEGENGTEESRQLSALNYQSSSVIQRNCEEQPLLVEYTRQPRRIGRVKSLKKFFYKGVLCFSYLILIIAALPTGISSGGLSFFRFDHRET
ncbi:unnamed protein product, partial [Porites evermanni]